MRGFHGQDFVQTAACEKFVSRFRTIADYFTEQNIEELSRLLGDYANISEQADAHEAFKAVLQSSASAAYFEYGAYHCRLINENIMERTHLYTEHEGGQIDFPLVLAC